jgi:hypothetical protein
MFLMPITRQKSPVFSIVSLPTDSVIVDHAVASDHICLKIEGAIFKITESVETYRKLP